MKPGKYKFIVQYTTTVCITIADPELFRKDFEEWESRYGDAACEPATEAEFLHSRARHHNAKYSNGHTRQEEHEHVYVEQLRTCRHCGCTEQTACELEDGPCSWAGEDLCNNPDCLAAAEKEGAQP